MSMDQAGDGTEGAWIQQSICSSISDAAERPKAKELDVLNESELSAELDNINQMLWAPQRHVL